MTKQNGTVLSILTDAKPAQTFKTPLRPDAFELPDEEKIAVISEHFRSIMQTLGLDLSDDSISGTPTRVAKMYVNEIFSGLNPRNKPEATLFENNYRYRQMLVERNITVQSMCEHHFVPIIGRAHVAYKSAGRVIGLSKINRIVHYYARRPQVQERLTIQVAEELKKVLGTKDVAVVIDAAHLCVSFRGIQDAASTTVTAEYDGIFHDLAVRQEFLRMIEIVR